MTLAKRVLLVIQNEVQVFEQVPMVFSDLHHLIVVNHLSAVVLVPDYQVLAQWCKGSDEKLRNDWREISVSDC